VKRLFARDVPQWLALVASLVMGVGLLLHLTADQQAGLNAVAVAVAGIITAVSVHDGVSAAVTGLIKAVIALVLAYGVHLSADWQVAIMSITAAVVAFFVTSRATAKVPPPVSLVAGSNGVVTLVRNPAAR
jgi:hypothetical protein